MLASVGARLNLAPLIMRHSPSRWSNGASIRRYRASSRSYIASRWYDGVWALVVHSVRLRSMNGPTLWWPIVDPFVSESCESQWWKHDCCHVRGRNPKTLAVPFLTQLALYHCCLRKKKDKQRTTHPPSPKVLCTCGCYALWDTNPPAYLGVGNYQQN